MLTGRTVERRNVDSGLFFELCLAASDGRGQGEGVRVVVRRPEVGAAVGTRADVREGERWCQGGSDGTTCDRQVDLCSSSRCASGD